ncbi:MAG: hypothetical protein NC238_07485 [Dehalobacter sp.]|nr:hypothetical protein [Dehalobacter sp.]
MALFKKIADPVLVSGREDQSVDIKIVKKPMICLIDTDNTVKSDLTRCGLTISSGTLGTPVIVPNEKEFRYRCCLPNYQIPSNLHEYDIVIVDVRDVELKEYIADEHTKTYTTGAPSAYFKCAYPETVFDPRPFGASQVRLQISELLNNGGLLIVFAGEKRYRVEYKFVAITLTGSQDGGSEGHLIYDFIPDCLIQNNKSGEQIFVERAQGSLFSLLGRYCENCRYHVTIHDFSSSKKNTSFFPLLRNSSNEVVGYLQTYGDGAIIVLPDIHDKSTFLHELLMNELPAMFPRIFPYHTQSRWLEEEPYYLPNQEKLIQKKDDAVVEFEKRISEIESEIAENIEKYSWLHGLLTKDGAELVRDVQKFLEWLEFDTVRYMDDPDKKIQEEDLQVDVSQGLLVIEVKGISGTSKDEDCSQINKIKYRRTKERGSFDVYALYIVNHQKHLPPLERENPPFKPEQIIDAQNEERGLLTTWQLFNLCFSIRAGGITKEDARKSLIEFGLVNFKPHGCDELGKPINVLKDGSVVLFDTKIPMSTDDFLIILRDERYHKAEIRFMKSNDETIRKIESGPVGIEINVPAKKSDIFLLKRSS